MSTPGQALVSPVQLAKEQLEFLRFAQLAEPEVLTALRALLPAWRDAGQARRGLLLYEWAARFNLYTPWALSFARLRLRMWAEAQAEPALEWPPGGFVVYRMKTAPAISVKWRPDTETVDEFLQRVQGAARGHVDETAANLVTLPAWRARRLTRRAGPKRAPEPLRWLAEFQVGRKSYYSIAKADQVTPAGVRKAVLAASIRVVLPLRSLKK